MITISWSLVSSYSICPYKVYHERSGHEHSSSWAMNYASAGHDALRTWAHGEDYLEAFDQRCQEYEKRLVEIPYWNGKYTDTDSAIITKAQIRNLLQKYVSAQDTPPERSMVEINLSRDLGNDVFLTGKIDWLGDPIVDWKFTNNPKYLSPVQALCYAILNGGPSRFEYHGMIKDRNPYWDVYPVPETEKQENLDALVEHYLKPIAKIIESGTFHANPDAFLCKPRYCGYWDVCNGHFV